MIDHSKMKKNSLKKSFYKLKAHHHHRKSRGNRHSTQWQREEDKWFFSHSLFFRRWVKTKKNIEKKSQKNHSMNQQQIYFYSDTETPTAEVVCDVKFYPKVKCLSISLIFCGLGKHFRLTVNLYKLIVIYLHTTFTLSLWNNSST